MSLSLKINTDELLALVADLDAVDEIAQRVMISTMSASLSVLEQNVKQRTPVSSGDTAASIGTNITKGMGVVKGELAFAADYAIYVEKGRGPGKQPPVDVMTLYAQRVTGARGKDARAIGYLIGRAIGARGTRGAFMLEKGWSASQARILGLWDDVPGKILSRVA